MRLERSIALPHRLRILQVLRGVGAMLVVLFHETWYGGKPVFLDRPMQLVSPWIPSFVEGQQIPGFFLWGHSGVDLFIVLSGFVMVWGYARDAGHPRRVWHYLRARFVRIYPTYWALFAIAVGHLWLRPGMNDRALEPALLARGFVLYGRNPAWQIPPAWTLPYEVMLYVFFTLLVLGGWSVFGLGAVLWCGAILGTWYGGLALGYHPILFSHLVLEFFLGCLGALFVMAVRPRVSGWGLAAVVVACVAAGIYDAFGVVRGSHHDFQNFAAPYLALTVAGAGYELAHARVYPRLLLLIGEASFSIYLSHFYMMHELHGIFGRYPVIQETIGRDAERVLVVATLIAIGVAVWAAIERPLLRRLRPQT